MFTLYIVLIGVILLLGIAARTPKQFHVERSGIVPAPLGAVLPLITDFRSWESWSPYVKLDPHMKKTYSGSSSGVGAVYEWEGNMKAGKGKIAIDRIEAPERVLMTLDMEKPMKGHNAVVFSFRETEEGTLVTWAMDGASPFLMRLLGLFIDTDHMVGRDFAEGIMNLAALFEAEPLAVPQKPV